MTYHIVMPTDRPDWVIHRMGSDLAMRNGWSFGDAPRENAQVTIFFPYLLACPVSGHSVAWFTHLEEKMPGKADMWKRAAESVHLRVAMNAGYVEDLAKYGPSIHIRPGIDMDHFTPQPADIVKTWPGVRVGVSGFTYPSGRKGEALLRSLVQDCPQWNFVASGKGWPVETQYHSWGEMPDYCRGLDVYLCTSMVEGGPVTILEALACGIPVVIPSHVGLCDELPEMPGIRHYQAGYAKAAAAAIWQATNDWPSRESLRQAVKPWGRERTHDDWLLAMADHFGTPAPKCGSWRVRGHSGVYIVAFGEPSRACAATLVESVRKYMPDLPIAVTSESPFPGVEYPLVLPDADIGGRSTKTRIYDLAPQDWEYVLYLDADTELTAPIPFLFQLVEDGWDVAICCNPGRYHLAENMYRPDNHNEIDKTLEELGTKDLEQLQGGVFAFRRNNRTRAFFGRWHQEWQRWGKRDQGALLRAYHAEPVRAYLLGIEWNTSTRYESPNGTAGILHYQMEARRWEGRIEGRLDSDEAWERVKEWNEKHR